MADALQSKHEKFRFPDKESLLDKAKALGVNIPYSDDINPILEPIEIGGKKASNRLAVHPMEGCDSSNGGAPSDLTFRRYKRFSAGGSGLVWFEATAVVHEGRSNPRQLYLCNETLDAFKALVEETRKAATDDQILILQLTHSGRFSKPDGSKKPITAQLNPELGPQNGSVITDDELLFLQDSFVSAATLAAEAGFDGVDIKACHGYLISELLSSVNRAKSRYGGSFENRIRFLIEVSEKIKAAAPSIFITSRISAFDAAPGGFGTDKHNPEQEDLDEPRALIKKLKSIGYPVVSISIGVPYYKPHFGRPFNKITAGAQYPAEHPLIGVGRLIRITGDLQKTAPELPMTGAGFSWLRHYFPNVGAGILKEKNASIIGVGRSSFAYPDAPRDLKNNNALSPDKVCTGCSGCTQIMRDGGRTGCVIRDKTIYLPQYKDGRRRTAGREGT